MPANGINRTAPHRGGEPCPITKAIYNRRRDNVPPDVRLAEHKASIAPRERGFMVSGRFDRREYGRLLDQLARTTRPERKPRRKVRAS